MAGAEIFGIQHFSLPYRKIFDCRQVWSVLFFRKRIAGATFSKFSGIKERHDESNAF
jgi:hypothetical protein